MTALHEYLLQCGQRYWPRGAELLAELAPPRATGPFGVACELVALPDWAADLGVGSPAALLIDLAAILPGNGEPFDRCDWWSAAWAHLSGAAERRVEAAAQPVHSYSFALTGVDSRLFDRAWVNRIFLLLRRLASRTHGQPEDALFGPRPTARLIITHDVDAVSKTVSLRCKQGAFHAFNAARLAVRGCWSTATRRAVHALRFAASPADYWTLPQLRALEESYGVRSRFHFFARPAGRWHTPRQWLFDPGYDVGASAIRAELTALAAGGWEIGLHQAFDSWQSAGRMLAERERLEHVAERPIVTCRQHWLRFSWADTWAAQEQAGFAEDTTLGFNDRPGFRNGAALCFHPWDHACDRPRRIAAVPLVLMDSHAYDYQLVAEDDLQTYLKNVLDEVRDVGGEASIVWHPHTLHADYGWLRGYQMVLNIITGRA